VVRHSSWRQTILFQDCGRAACIAFLGKGTLWPKADVLGRIVCYPASDTNVDVWNPSYDRFPVSRWLQLRHRQDPSFSAHVCKLPQSPTNTAEPRVPAMGPWVQRVQRAKRMCGHWRAADKFLLIFIL
jgi:hypothetical protein